MKRPEKGQKEKNRVLFFHRLRIASWSGSHIHSCFFLKKIQLMTVCSNQIRKGETASRGEVYEKAKNKRHAARIKPWPSKLMWAGENSFFDRRRRFCVRGPVWCDGCVPSYPSRVLRPKLEAHVWAGISERRARDIYKRGSDFARVLIGHLKNIRLRK